MFLHLCWTQHRCSLLAFHWKSLPQPGDSLWWCHYSRILLQLPGFHLLIWSLLFPTWQTAVAGHVICTWSVLFHHLLCSEQSRCLFWSMDLIKKSRKWRTIPFGKNNKKSSYRLPICRGMAWPTSIPVSLNVKKGERERAWAGRGTTIKKIVPCHDLHQQYSKIPLVRLNLTF